MYADGKPKPTSKGSKGAELVDGLVIKEEDYKVVKTRFSAFFATHLHSFLQGAGIDSLVVVGKSTFSYLLCYYSAMSLRLLSVRHNLGIFVLNI